MRERGQRFTRPRPKPMRPRPQNLASMPYDLEHLTSLINMCKVVQKLQFLYKMTKTVISRIN